MKLLEQVYDVPLGIRLIEKMACIKNISVEFKTNL